jgi:hypothetical protein
MGLLAHVASVGKKCIQILKERDHCKHVDLHERIIKEYNLREWTGFICHMIRSSDAEPSGYVIYW